MLHMFPVFLLSHRSTRESLRELKKAVETLACCSCSHSISRSPRLPLEFSLLDRNASHVFYFLNNAFPAHHIVYWLFNKLNNVVTLPDVISIKQTSGPEVTTRTNSQNTLTILFSPRKHPCKAGTIRNNYIMNKQSRINREV